MGSSAEQLYNLSPAWLQNVLVSAYGYRLYRKRYGGDFRKILDQVRASRQWSDEEIQAYQDEKLFEMVRHCRQHVPYYQRLFAEHGLHEKDITSTSDLHKLPILTKQELRTDPESFKAPGFPGFMTQHTSGSTGTPLVLEVNALTYRLAMALVVEHEEHHGVPFGARRATFAGRMVQPSTDMKPPFARMNRAENQKLFSSYHLNAETFPWYRRELDRFQPKELIGYPSAICDLANHYRTGQVTPEFKPTAIITNSETLLDWQRDIIEQVFRCPIWDYYGTAEYVLFAGQETSGYRVNPIIGVTELLRGEDHSEPLGQLIATSLTNTSMPLLRYEIGDQAEPYNSTDSDHSIINQLGRIAGRLDDYIETPDGRKIGRIDHIFKGLENISEAQIIQDAPDHCTILIQQSPIRPGADQEKQLIENFKARTANRIGVQIQYTSMIPRGANGKFKAVVRQTSCVK
ncbi:phenylacetate--CoA ligase family protein [Marinobacter sp. LN3S78]|uniref:phenylacetate--CoA ligase family protein n=1 Tax=Marinobacter sp. LN3S78 TaxID=3382300 RepID=UPI00387AE46D